MTRRIFALFVVAGLVVAVAGCAGFRAERQGRDLGRSICKVKHSSNPDQGTRAMNQLNRDLQRAQQVTGRPVNQDIRDIDRNLSDLQQHAASGQATLAQQDVASIRRNIEQFIDTAPGLTKRFYQGVDEGLGDCV
jgi:hypothetical protein